MRVLVADDVQSLRMLYSTMLQNRGHCVKTVENGKEALEQLEKEDFDVVLMDLQMPVMDGLEAARIIRSQDSAVRRHEVPIIAVSAVEEGRGKKWSIEAGMNGYLSKPVKYDEFVQYVENYAPKWAVELRVGPGGSPRGETKNGVRDGDRP